MPPSSDVLAYFNESLSINYVREQIIAVILTTGDYYGTDVVHSLKVKTKSLKEFLIEL